MVRYHLFLHLSCFSLCTSNLPHAFEEASSTGLIIFQALLPALARILRVKHAVRTQLLVLTLTLLIITLRRPRPDISRYPLAPHANGTQCYLSSVFLSYPGFVLSFRAQQRVNGGSLSLICIRPATQVSPDLDLNYLFDGYIPSFSLEADAPLIRSSQKYIKIWADAPTRPDNRFRSHPLLPLGILFQRETDLRWLHKLWYICYLFRFYKACSCSALVPKMAKGKCFCPASRGQPANEHAAYCPCKSVYPHINSELSCTPSSISSSNSNRNLAPLLDLQLWINACAHKPAMLNGPIGYPWPLLAA